MATERDEFHLKVRKRFMKDHLESHKNEDENYLLQPMGYKGKPESPYTLSNLLWLLAAGLCFYYTDFMNVVFFDARTSKLYLNIGLVLVSVNVAICMFLVVWLTYIKKISSNDWEKLYPKAIPIAAFSFLFGACFVTAGLWPIWRFFTPFILFTIFMGGIVIITWLPSWM